MPITAMTEIYEDSNLNNFDSGSVITIHSDSDKDDLLIEDTSSNVPQYVLPQKLCKPRKRKRPKPPKPCRKLHLKGLPTFWGYKQTKEFLGKEIKSFNIYEVRSIKNMTMLKNSDRTSNGEWIIKFILHEQAVQARTDLQEFAKNSENKIEVDFHLGYLRAMQLQRKMSERKSEKLQMENSSIMTNQDETSMPSTSQASGNLDNVSEAIFTKYPGFVRKIRDRFQNRAVMPMPDVTRDTYGLSVPHLNNLKVRVPLRNKVCVTNLAEQVDEDKLREVFSLAGKVVDVYLQKNVDGTYNNMATVEYDHPVEAVQAISMFHNKPLYGRELRVRPESKKTKSLLPEGLESIGPGLGPHGFPLKNIRTTIELESIEQDLVRCGVLKNTFHKKTKRTKPAKTKTAREHTNADAVQQNKWRPEQSQTWKQNFSDYKDNKEKSNDDTDKASEILVFQNLPLSMSLQALKTKISEAGELVFAKMTGQGRVMVRFKNNQDADKCITLFHHSEMDGQIIEVAYFTL